MVEMTSIEFHKQISVLVWDVVTTIDTAWHLLAYEYAKNMKQISDLTDRAISENIVIFVVITRGGLGSVSVDGLVAHDVTITIY